MRISSLSPSARAAVLPNNANAIVNNRRDTLIVSVPLSCFDWPLKNRRVLGARSVEKVAAGLGELELQSLHQFGDWRRVGDLADALAGAPDVAPRLGLGVAAGAEIHLRLVAERQVVGIEARGHDRGPEIIAVHAGEKVGVDDVVRGVLDQCGLV